MYVVNGFPVVSAVKAVPRLLLRVLRLSEAFPGFLAPLAKGYLLRIPIDERGRGNPLYNLPAKGLQVMLGDAPGQGRC